MVTYRLAHNTDAEALLQTRRCAVLQNRTDNYSNAILEAWAPTVDAATIHTEAEALTDPDRVTLVAEIEGKMVGLCTLGVTEGLLKQCYVLPEYNGLGIARELVKQIEVIAKERGVRTLKLSSSLIALDFYKKQGYTELYSYHYDLGDGLQMPCVMMEKGDV